MLDVSFSSELGSCFTSQAARNLLKETRGNKNYEDANTCPSTDSSLDGNDILVPEGDIESQCLKMVEAERSISPPITKKQVHDGLACKTLEEDDEEMETLWDVTEKAPKEKKLKKKKKKKDRRHRERKDGKKVRSGDRSKRKDEQDSEKNSKVGVLVVEEPKPVVEVEESTSVAEAEEPQPVVEVKEPQVFVLGVNPETEPRTKENLRDARVAQKRLDALRGSTDTRDHVELWKEKRYCHRMFRHRAQVDYPNETCMELWEVPERMSLSKTYSQVHHGAQSIARYVAAACAETTTKNRAVCLYLPRGYELIASVIGIWYSGACLNVTDTKLPWQRLEFIVGDASAALIITTESLVGENPNNMPCPILNVNAIIADGTETDKVGANLAQRSRSCGWCCRP